MPPVGQIGVQKIRGQLSTGSEVMRRIAAPMVGGMITATALTLVVIPAMFLVWQRFRLRSPAAAPANPGSLGSVSTSC